MNGWTAAQWAAGVQEGQLEGGTAAIKSAIPDLADAGRDQVAFDDGLIGIRRPSRITRTSPRAERGLGQLRDLHRLQVRQSSKAPRRVALHHSLFARLEVDLARLFSSLGNELAVHSGKFGDALALLLFS